jgi:hypothetical protein
MVWSKLTGSMNGENHNTLELDTHTLADLELFGSAESGGLFEYCDYCKTDGGRAALKRRMMSPWANPVKIRATQESIAYISRHRDIFEALPSAYLASHVDRYLGAGMPIVRAKNSLELVRTLFICGQTTTTTTSKSFMGSGFLNSFCWRLGKCWSTQMRTVSLANWHRCLARCDP